MEANAPEKIYLHPSVKDGEYNRHWLIQKVNQNSVEYARTDAFIEKACEFLKSYRQDTPDGFGYIPGIVNNKTIEDFVKYMEE